MVNCVLMPMALSTGPIILQKDSTKEKYIVAS
jgi:hypothetical protein